jgi:hypothetical protein
MVDRGDQDGLGGRGPNRVFARATHGPGLGSIEIAKVSGANLHPFARRLRDFLKISAKLCGI